MSEFQDQVAVVTGGTRGIGRAIARGFAERGATVYATYTSNEEAAKAFEAECAELSGKVLTRKFDVADHGAVEAFFAGLDSETGGRIDILVNNGGIRKDGLLISMAPEAWQRVIDVNLTGCFNTSKFAVLLMMKRRYGRIINITSPSGKHGFAGQTNYGASKAGQVGMTKALAKEVAKRKITVNCVSPGFIDTELIEDLPEELRKQYLEQVPLKRFGTPADVAHAVFYLASEGASYVTGTVLEVTGGL